MTDTIQRTDVPPRGRPSTEHATRRLRTVLAMNATTSAACGIAGVVAAPYWSDTLGIDSTGWIRIVGAGLVAFAFGVALVAAIAGPTVAIASLAVSLGDLAWVAATIVALNVITFTTAGWIVAVVVALGVLDFALLQLWFRRGAADGYGVTTILQ